jgi:hypothetical protein
MGTTKLCYKNIQPQLLVVAIDNLKLCRFDVMSIINLVGNTIYVKYRLIIQRFLVRNDVLRFAEQRVLGAECFRSWCGTILFSVRNKVTGSL